MKQKVTPFQQRVYDACSRIPSGKVTTYAELAREIACKSPRAVGQALRCNPFAPEVPCHRVVKSDRDLGVYTGQTMGPQLEKKKTLLIKEGVCFESDRIVHSDSLYTYPDD